MPPQVVVRSSLAVGALKLDTCTPCGFTPLITCRIVPSLPAASMAWNTIRTAVGVLAASRSCIRPAAHALAEQLCPSFFLDTESCAGVEVLGQVDA